MTKQDITPYWDWTNEMLRNEEPAVVSRTPGIQEWVRSFCATAARIDRFLQLGHRRSRALPQSLVLDVIELDQAELTDALDAEGLLKNFVLFWGAVADVYGITRKASELEAYRLDLLVEWSLLLTALSGSGYPGMKLLGSPYGHERARLALTKLRKGEADFANVALGLQLVTEREAELGIRWNGQSGAFTRRDEDATGEQSSRQQLSEPGRKYEGQYLVSSVAAKYSVYVEEPTLRFELYGNWQDHWRNTSR